MLTSECANCPFWRDTETEIGCAFPRPISECKAFADEYKNDVELGSEERYGVQS